MVGYALLTRPPVAAGGGRSRPRDAPRLACVRPVASVHPEPGSNSASYILFWNLFFCCLLSGRAPRGMLRGGRPARLSMECFHLSPQRGEPRLRVQKYELPGKTQGLRQTFFRAAAGGGAAEGTKDPGKQQIIRIKKIAKNIKKYFFTSISLALH